MSNFDEFNQESKLQLIQNDILSGNKKALKHISNNL